MEASRAMNTLKFIPRKSARLISKTLQSAMANAENNHNLNADDLTVSEAIIEEGRTMRRFIPVPVALPILSGNDPATSALLFQNNNRLRTITLWAKK